MSKFSFLFFPGWVLSVLFFPGLIKGVIVVFPSMSVKCSIFPRINSELLLLLLSLFFLGLIKSVVIIVIVSFSLFFLGWIKSVIIVVFVRMSESLQLRGYLVGHNGWVTQIATNRNFPDMILSASRGECVSVCVSLCVFSSFSVYLYLSV